MMFPALISYKLHRAKADFSYVEPSWYDIDYD